MTSSISHLALPLGERLAGYTPTSDADTILGILSWCVSAAGVFGMIAIGLQMALQLRRGEMGEGATYFRGGFYVVLGCLLATTAGPLVSFLGDLSLF
ncbi:hypothetical protein [Streptomyces sp. KMM 9044]|uniref:hypothetical protein n=1 Tax=Streptomyces sp. KMM 9044 TaxID=2744474 RepID=UPI0021517B95|nr:hypothetical protein [Streptomyces sp. KMM 9044]WAX78898.1 hypothetical protein HUV60_015590 [Streptomyces sp. KMM 9044]